MKHPMQIHLEKQLQDLNNRVSNAEVELAKQNQHFELMKRRFKGGMQSNTGAYSLEQNMMQAHVNSLMPGNVGDINRVIWPFWFTTENVTLAPNQSANANFTVTQEAAFVLLSYTRAVYVQEAGQDNIGQFQYVDPEAQGAAGKTNDLNFVIQDSQSSRSFMNTPLSVNHIGYWRKPTVMTAPPLFLPNSNIEVTWQNNSSINTYKPFMTFFGYRVRIDHAQDILSTVSG